MRIALYAVLALGLVVAGVLAYATTLPDRFEVARSTTIAAPPETIFPMIDNLRTFATWSPYETKDPDMKRTFSGPESGVGARYDWEGDRQVGKGTLVIAQSAPPSKVMIDLTMLKPIEARNAVTFTLAPEGGSTKVTWAMAGAVPLVARIVHLCFDMDRMVGGDFEAGLASLKAKAEAAHAAPPRT